MNLIIELYDPKEKLSVMISDCMVSDKEDSDREKSSFPIHFESGWNIDARGRSIVSKALTVDEGIILSAGAFFNIESIAIEFRQRATEGAGGRNFIEGFQTYLDTYYSSRRATEAFIYSYRFEGKTTVSDTGCKRRQLCRFQITFAGSGGDYLEKWMAGKSPGEDTGVFQVAIQLLAYLVRLEFSDYELPDFGFGGAYEVFVFDADGPKRLTYSIVDFVAESTLCSDGAYEIGNPKLNRVILCQGRAKGTLIGVLLSDHRAQHRLFEVNEVGQGDMLGEGNQSIKDVFGTAETDFDILLIRHQEVNVKVSHGLIAPEICEDGRVYLNQERTDRLIRSEFFYVPHL